MYVHMVLHYLPLPRTAQWCMTPSQWPAVEGDTTPANADLKLYGAAAFERALDELQQAMQLMHFPDGP